LTTKGKCYRGLSKEKENKTRKEKHVSVEGGSEVRYCTTGGAKQGNVVSFHTPFRIREVYNTIRKKAEKLRNIRPKKKQCLGLQP